jgi:hypothetical protein
MIKSFFDKLLIGVGGALATAVIYYFFSPSGGPIPSVQAAWVAIPIPRSVADYAELEKQAPILEKVFQTKDIPELVQTLRFNSSFMIFEVTITNNTNQVSKSFEISADKQLFGFASRERGKNVEQAYFRKAVPVAVQPLNPHESVQVILLTERLFWYSELPVRALYDGKLVSIRPAVMTDKDDEFGIVSFLIRNPFIQFLMLPAVFFIVLFGLILVALQSVQNKFSELVQIMSNKEAERIVRLADYLRAEHPHKLSRSLQAPPAVIPVLATSPAPPTEERPNP